MSDPVRPPLVVAESDKALILRFVAYTAAIAALAHVLPAVVERAGVGVFKEGGVVECLQLGLLVAASAVFLVGAAAVASFRVLFRLLALLAAFASVRELDSVLDDGIPLLGWKLPGVLIAGVVAVLAWRNRRAARQQVACFLACRGFALLWAGFVIVVVLAQFVGRGVLLRLVMGYSYYRAPKRVIEEALELAGYLILLIGAIESLCQLRSLARATPPAADRGGGAPQPGSPAGRADARG